MNANENNKETMEKIEIAKILEWHNSGTLKTDEAIEKIFSLFSVRLSLLAEKAADEATERYEHIRGADYGNGLEHGFESGAEWIVEELKCNEA